MKIAQITTQGRSPNDQDLAELIAIKPQLVWVFGGIKQFTAPDLLGNLKSAFGDAQLLGCSTAGEISQDGVSDEAIVVTALHFEKNTAESFSVATIDIAGMEDSKGAGERLAQQLQNANLHDVIVLGQGVNINGSALIDGFRQVLPTNTTLSGGLAADAGAFTKLGLYPIRAYQTPKLSPLVLIAPTFRLITAPSMAGNRLDQHEKSLVLPATSCSN